ncbi:hypothetical protein PVT68_07370 [Microbulbifer bruguierae]|uniref:Tetratricopeptide repeat protein n=1 Tax=Microbulbifer bruguierae TaxID=3029061 RepID=A0ABY8NGQ1_9GAMM|nr:hypothetical protein [Microbulbifer bruguierae]WGL18106.1 hypothetical protein PVT68_07370 [Microbulbifer bruguierae]
MLTNPGKSPQFVTLLGPLAAVLLLIFSFPTVATEPNRSYDTAVEAFAYRGRPRDQVELAAYGSSPSPCQGEHSDWAVDVGLSNYAKWARLFDELGRGDPRTLKAFDDQIQALAYLVTKLDCQDPLIRYRYANALYQQRSYTESLAVLETLEKPLQEYYPDFYPMYLNRIAAALRRTDQHDRVINIRRELADLVPGDVSNMLNLAGMLSVRDQTGDAQEARLWVARARQGGLSLYGEKVAGDIIARLRVKHAN